MAVVVLSLWVMLLTFWPKAFKSARLPTTSAALPVSVMPTMRPLPSAVVLASATATPVMDKL